MSLLRTACVGLCRGLLKIFFRRSELIGRENIPDDGLVLFVLNHPSGLVDPLFVLCLSGRRVSFLAKEPLFRMPVVGTFVRSFESLPVYRTRDGADPQKNRAMLDAARRLLIGGNALALFPEGTSHSEPHLKPLRSGAARLALSTRTLSGQKVYLVPGGLFYEEKQSFRSRALLILGRPLSVPEVELDDRCEPPFEVTQQVTSVIQKAIEEVIPTADTIDGLSLSETAERLFSAAIIDHPKLCPSAKHLAETEALHDPSPSLFATRVRRRARFIAAYQRLIQTEHAAATELISDILRLKTQFEDQGKDIDALDASSGNSSTRHVWVHLASAVLLLPLALIGGSIFGPAYFSVRFIATRYAAEEADITATVKLLAGALLFPLSWSLAVFLIWFFRSTNWALATALVLPLSAASAVIVRDSIGAVLYRVHERKSLRGAGEEHLDLRESRARVAERMAQMLARTQKQAERRG